MWFIVVLSVLLFRGGLCDLVVQLQNGKVNGTTIDTPSGQMFYAWRGIPFAKPPVGELRFLPPERPEPWTDVLDASQDSPACIFFITYATDPVPTNGNSEDCLYINVYSPIPVGSNSSVDPTLPVMFWIYGGGFSTGTGDFSYTDPTPFLEEKVIVVTFNYRLGTLGFLSTQDEVIRGNAGLKDQALALKWTNENIASFGGNPSEITIFGESAGSSSVGAHIVSPMSRNLFKRAIMESGSGLLGGRSNAKEVAFTMASKADPSITNSSTSQQVLEVLQSVDVDLILNITVGLSTGIVLEPKSNFSFVSEPFYETYEAGDIARVPTIIGYNSEEAIVALINLDYGRSQASRYDLDPELLVQTTMHLKENVTKKQVAEEIRELYLANNETFAENLAIYYDMSSDNMLLRSTHKQAVLQSKYSPVYMYQFSFYGTLSKGHLILPGAGKVGHAEEVGYLFNISTKPLKTDEDYLTRKRFVKLWTNFAKTSNPTPDDDSAELLQNVKWEPVTEDNLHYLDIDDDLEIKPNRKVKEDIFWNYLWSTYSYRPYSSF